MLAAMIGNFQDGSAIGKMQHGSAWWFLDQKDGMEEQMRVLPETVLDNNAADELATSLSIFEPDPVERISVSATV